jgi:hypothetical protein
LIVWRRVARVSLAGTALLVSPLAAQRPLADRAPLGLPATPAPLPDSASLQQRPRAMALPAGYGIRLQIHKIGSFAILGAMGAEYFVGRKLLQDRQDGVASSRGLRSAHGALAGTIGGLFAVNTVTGLWNLIDSRHVPEGRTRRWIHGLAMLVADAGFLYTASLAEGEHDEFRGGTLSAVPSNRNVTHRNAAIASISLSTAATLMMWIWR